jgi:hypothetical protein
MTATTCDLAATTTVEDNTPEALAHQLRAHLQAIAKQGNPITYGEAARVLRLVPPNTIHQVTAALERLMADDAAADRPFIAAMVISKARGGMPAPGFFEDAGRLGRFAGDPAGPEAWAYHAREFDAAVAFWAASEIPGETGLKHRRET